MARSLKHNPGENGKEIQMRILNLYILDKFRNYCCVKLVRRNQRSSPASNCQNLRGERKEEDISVRNVASWPPSTPRLYTFSLSL